jgi:hypothetical protein
VEEMQHYILIEALLLIGELEILLLPCILKPTGILLEGLELKKEFIAKVFVSTEIVMEICF